MKKTKTQKGITLVALIITIIVLLILAVVTINAVKGDGIIQQAESATQKYNDAAVNEQAKIDSYIGKIDEFSPKVVHSGIIPKGATYTTGARREEDEDYYGEIFTYTNASTLDSGKNFPTEPKAGDVYVYGDYKYIYQGARDYVAGGEVHYVSGAEAWGVVVRDYGKVEYGEILTSINNKEVKWLDSTFYMCDNLTVAPKIPNTITSMAATFLCCEELKTASAIPASVTEMYWTFHMCPKLEGEVEVNANPTSYDGCFEDTEKEITITGSCSAATKAALAATAEAGNVKY